MKCNKCGNEWKTDASRSASITVCPFCQEKIVTGKSSDWPFFDSTKELLAYIATEYGNDALFGRKYFSDHTLPSMPQGQKNLVKQAFECGAIKILQDNMDSNQARKETAVKQAIGKLVATYASAKDAAERVVWEFTNAIGWGMPEPQVSVISDPVTDSGANNLPIIHLPTPDSEVSKLMTRAWFFAEDGDWKDAADYFNKALDTEPTYAPAYLGLLCVDLKLSNENKLANVKNPDSIINHKYYKRAAADLSIKARLDSYILTIKNRIDAEQKAAAAEAEKQRKIAEEVIRRKGVLTAFSRACSIMTNAQSSDDYIKAINAFGSIDSNYQDINNQIKIKIAECETSKAIAEGKARKKIVQDAFDSAYKIMDNAHSPDDYRKAIIAFDSIDSKYEDISNRIRSIIVECETKKTEMEEAERTRREYEAFQDACKIMNDAQNSDDYSKAITAFNSIDTNYQDLDTKISNKVVECETKKTASEKEYKRKNGILYHPLRKVALFIQIGAIISLILATYTYNLTYMRGAFYFSDIMALIIIAGIPFACFCYIFLRAKKHVVSRVIILIVTILISLYIFVTCITASRSTAIEVFCETLFSIGCIIASSIAYVIAKGD